MTRTLPWLKPTTSSTRPEAVHSAKRQKLNDPDSKDLSEPPAIQTPPNRTRVVSQLAKRQSREQESRALSDSAAHPREGRIRTPSTSPPRPPPESGFMIEGLDNDDIYVMVEDEFYDVAKSFTAHLHQAEYIRQRQMMQDRSAQKGSTTPDALLSANEAKNSAADTPVGSKKTTKGQSEHGAVIKTSEPTDDVVRSRLSRSSAENKETRTGNSLLRLLGSPSKTQPALINHHGSVPKTRASAGFVQARTPTRSNKTWKGPRTADLKTMQALADDGDASDTASENDLDAPLTSALLLSRRSSRSTKNRSSPGGLIARAARQQISPKSTQPRQSLGQARLPDLSSPTSLISRLTPTKTPNKKSTRTVDEIPTFLV